jgi:activator of HSP90 ATPase
VEKSIVPWCKKELETRFSSLVIYDGPLGYFKFTSLKNLDGSICAHVRRGRRFVMYEYNMSFNWEGHVPGEDGSKEVKGVVKIPYMGDENDYDDFEFEVSVDVGKATKAKSIVYQECKKVLKKAVKEFMEFMNQKWTEGPIKSDSQSEVKRCTLKNEEQPAPSASAHPSTKETVTSTSKSGKNKNLTQKVTLNGPVQMIFQTFLDKDRLSAFTQSETHVEPKVGGAFRLFSGNVTGEFVEIESEKKIVQKWRFSDWKPDVYSTVTLTFEASSSQTTIRLSQTNIPADDLSRTKEGWNRFYWNNFRNIFGGNIGAFV